MHFVVCLFLAVIARVRRQLLPVDFFLFISTGLYYNWNFRGKQLSASVTFWSGCGLGVFRAHQHRICQVGPKKAARLAQRLTTCPLTTANGVRSQASTREMVCGQ